MSYPDTMTNDDKILHFPDGIPGFQQCTRFMLMDMVEDGAFQMLQCVDDPDVALVVCIPWLFFPDYTPEISELDESGLGLESAEDAIVFTPVTLDPEGQQFYVNLLGPFIVNAKSRQGRQIVLVDSNYPVRAPVALMSA